MQRCQELAQRGAGNVAPNPMVGAVLVHNDRIIGEGWHEVYGQAHAEVNCFEQVAAVDRPLIPHSRMYVSLEPCAHTGKTPPCAHRIVQEGVPEVIIANRDPFEKVDGAGIEILKQAGVAVRTGVLEEAGHWVNRRFFCFHEQRRPYLILKWAESVEGFIAPADRSRTQLTNHYSNTLVHRWRTEEAAIMVGYQTALHDDPRLTARHWPGNQPLRIVLDKQLQLPLDRALFNDEATTWIINQEKEATSNNLHFIRPDFTQNILPQLLDRLYQEGKTSLIVEGGARLLQTFIEAGLWDEARLFQTPTSIPDGITAPLLTHARLVQETDLAGDQLQLWVNKSSPYAYVPGMSL